MSKSTSAKKTKTSLPRVEWLPVTSRSYAQTHTRTTVTLVKHFHVTYSLSPWGCRLGVRQSWWTSFPRWCDSCTLVLRALELWETLLPHLALSWSGESHPRSEAADPCEDWLEVDNSSPCQHSRSYTYQWNYELILFLFESHTVVSYPQSMGEILEPWGIPSACLKYLQPTYTQWQIKTQEAIP